MGNFMGIAAGILKGFKFSGCISGTGKLNLLTKANPLNTNPLIAYY
jgi:hypothetical protein